MTKDTLVEILQTSDGMRIDMRAAMLRSNDILVATPGRTHNAMVPHWGGVIAIPLLVPEEQADRALQLIAEWESSEPADGASSGEPASATIPTQTRKRFRWTVAAFGSVVFPGLAHAHAELYGRAKILAAAALAMLISAVLGVEQALPLYLLIIPVDFIGAVIARKAEPDPPRVETAVASSSTKAN